MSACEPVYCEDLKTCSCALNVGLSRDSTVAQLLPKTIRTLSKLPQLHRTVLAARRIKLAIRRKARGPNRAVMPLIRLQLLLLLKVPKPNPRVVLVATASNEAVLSLMQSHARQLIRRLDALDERARREAVEEVGAVSSCYAQCAVRGGIIQLARAHCALDGVLANRALCAQVPPPNHLIFGGGDNDVGVRRPYYRLDAARVNARANLEAGRRVALR